LEEEHVNLNQGAESTVCYLMARLTMERYIRKNSPKYFAPKMIEWEDPESLRLLN